MEQQRGGLPPFSFAQGRAELSLELVHATEAAALACASLLGKGEPERVSAAAIDAIKVAFEESALTGTVVLSPRHQTNLPHGLVLGGGERKVDLGIYALEGASQVARGHINSITTLVAVEPGAFPRLPAVTHVEKFVAGPAARGAVDVDDSIADNLRRIAFANEMRVQDLTVAILERPRHQELISEVSATGARIRTLEEGDFASAVMAAVSGTGIDAAIGVGDMHAALIAACAVRCLGGEFVARLVPRNDEEKSLVAGGVKMVYGLADLAPTGDVDVAITGVSGGPLLPGVTFGSGYAETTSLVMSSRRGTVRHITTRHGATGLAASR